MKRKIETDAEAWERREKRLMMIKYGPTFPLWFLIVLAAIQIIGIGIVSVITIYNLFFK